MQLDVRGIGTNRLARLLAVAQRDDAAVTNRHAGNDAIHCVNRQHSSAAE